MQFIWTKINNHLAQTSAPFKEASFLEERGQEHEPLTASWIRNQSLMSIHQPPEGMTTAKNILLFSSPSGGPVPVLALEITGRSMS